MNCGEERGDEKILYREEVEKGDEKILNREEVQRIKGNGSEQHRSIQNYR